MYSVGQLAKRTGVTIKTLHYYEQLGLLCPSRDPKSGYRMYCEEDIMKLQEISVLKEMGFRLSEIQAIMEKSSPPQPVETATTVKGQAWKTVIARQLEAVHAKQEHLQYIETLLTTVQYALEVTDHVNIEEIMRFIKELNAPEKLSREQYRSGYFTQDELRKLPDLKNDDPLALEWAKLLNDIGSHINEPADSPASRRLAAQVMEISDKLFSDDEELSLKYWEFIRPRDGEAPSLYGMSREVMDYIERILDHYIDSE
ncbi:MerR family transcriptional regulator [Brevibacillus formosus]|uniref:MerR family transcriptional regulator n=1 Tax=Brevibacillus TaxID=55080 RepID=UPI000D0E63BE|nr:MULTISPECIES: MerR family transcriptional regulator [Brevibacillus]MBG9942742.1 hypothetical protein [Brevibacillus formosus]MED1945113.1 MerR family transcriptional regulator [Brevibacillus formosus]MED1996200.1 MerR family transcriptional regulator [Brevibacillus formosus]MED2081169.1 MerR family transcriptional regulator [Brevibacillus formosus]PSK14381.1 MerR family transcriptional regulator [Brevibacillus sp. NRRL NRS-603]